jgi:hypothetical protein
MLVFMLLVRYWQKARLMFQATLEFVNNLERTLLRQV